jgi:ribosomal protein S18 acetylase RimI-like enzyme
MSEDSRRGPIIRPAEVEDLPRVASLAGRLVREHHGWDERRFLLVEPIEPGYEGFFRREVRRAQASVLVAEVDGQVEGYAYGTLEPRDWNALLDRHGALHDIYVDARSRRRGVATALLRAMLGRLGELGAPRVVLHSAWQNADAHAFFESAGFRRTMLEMTRETDPP